MSFFDSCALVFRVSSVPHGCCAERNFWLYTSVRMHVEWCSTYNAHCTRSTDAVSVTVQFTRHWVGLGSML